MPGSNPTVVFEAPRRVTVESRPVPVPGPHELLVETRATLISTGTELAIFDGLAAGIKYPSLPGYSNVGVVVANGSEVASDWQGRRVASLNPHAKYVLVPEPEAIPISGSSDDRDSAFFFLASIALNGLRRGTVTGGEVAAVFGLGLLGQLVVRFCRLFGVRPVVAVDRAAQRLDFVREIPGVVTAGPEDAEETVAGQTQGRMADVVFDVTGRQDAILDEASCAREQGRVVVLGSPRGPAVPFDFYWGCHRRSLSIIGAHTLSHPPHDTPGAPWTVKRHAQLFFEMLEHDEIKTDRLITEVVAWAESATAFHELARDRSAHMGVIIDWSE